VTLFLLSDSLSLRFNSINNLGMMNNYQQIEATLRKNIDDVYKLIEFDHLILKFCLSSLTTLNEKLKKTFKINNPNLLVSKTITHLKRIRENDSLRLHYQIMFNQSNVLLVSLFASAVADLFRDGVNSLAELGNSEELMKEEFKLSVDEIMEHGHELPHRIGYVIADKKDISFQDMKSIRRAFHSYFSVSMEKNETVNNIIFAQAARHVIVHDSARISERMINQISGAVPRRIMNKISAQDTIQFDREEIKIIGESMLIYFCELRSKVEERLNVNN
jgi:hypothetical protein